MCYACPSEALKQMLKLCVFLCVIMLFIYVQCMWKANVHAYQIHHIFRHIIPYTFTPNPTHRPSLLSFYPHLHHPTVLRPVHNVPTKRQACHFLAQDFKIDVILQSQSESSFFFPVCITYGNTFTPKDNQVFDVKMSILYFLCMTDSHPSIHPTFHFLLTAF